MVELRLANDLLIYVALLGDIPERLSENALRLVELSRCKEQTHLKDAVAFSFNCSALLCVTVVLRRTLIVKRYITATCITACTAKGHVSAAGMLEVVMGNTEVTKLLQSDGL